jgi:predicted HicB family RNase H-like nuclease
MMEYKGYIGRVEFDDEAGIFHGEVVNTRDVITFQGTTVAQLRVAFHESVDDYLDFCRERGEQPEKPHSGRFVTRVSPDLHRRISRAAAAAGKSLNAWVAEQLERDVETQKNETEPAETTRTKSKPAKQPARPRRRRGPVAT